MTIEPKDGNWMYYDYFGNYRNGCWSGSNWDNYSNGRRFL